MGWRVLELEPGAIGSGGGTQARRGAGAQALGEVKVRTALNKAALGIWVPEYRNPPGTAELGGFPGPAGAVSVLLTHPHPHPQVWAGCPASGPLPLPIEAHKQEMLQAGPACAVLRERARDPCRVGEVHKASAESGSFDCPCYTQGGPFRSFCPPKPKVTAILIHSH